MIIIITCTIDGKRASTGEPASPTNPRPYLKSYTSVNPQISSVRKGNTKCQEKRMDNERFCLVEQ